VSGTHAEKSRHLRRPFARSLAIRSSADRRRVLGDMDASLRIDGIDVRFAGYQDRSARSRAYLRRGRLRARRAADTFPSAILEALACGTPVVATAVGGIPEQINSGADRRHWLTP
jgi:glycosyltransferase involved in cell wall biosynthesis